MDPGFPASLSSRRVTAGVSECNGMDIQEIDILSLAETVTQCHDGGTTAGMCLCAKKNVRIA